MGRDHEDGRGSRQGAGPGEELGDPERIVDQGRRAVAQVDGRHAAIYLGAGGAPHDRLCGGGEVGRGGRRAWFELLIHG